MFSRYVTGRGSGFADSCRMLPWNKVKSAPPSSSLGQASGSRSEEAPELLLLPMGQQVKNANELFRHLLHMISVHGSPSQELH